MERWSEQVATPQQRMTDTHRTLHAWVKNLCRREVIRIITPHDLRTTNDPLQIVLPSHVPSPASSTRPGSC